MYHMSEEVKKRYNQWLEIVSLKKRFCTSQNKLLVTLLSDRVIVTATVNGETLPSQRFTNDSAGMLAAVNFIKLSYDKEVTQGEMV